MAPTSNIHTLQGFQPTQEELDHAKKVLEQGKHKAKSQMQSMVNWCKKNESPANEEVICSRGQDRLDYLAKYMCFQARSQKSLNVFKRSEHEAFALIFENLSQRCLFSVGLLRMMDRTLLHATCLHNTFLF